MLSKLKHALRVLHPRSIARAHAQVETLRDDLQDVRAELRELRRTMERIEVRRQKHDDRHAKDVEREREKARDTIATLVRLQTAQGLAPAFLERPTPYKDDPQLRALIDDGLLHHAAFIQKPPRMLQFYQRLFLSLASTPTAILEIGVKGGGSTAFWKAVFPDATIVGVDINLRRSVREEPSPDGVIYLQGDQTDEGRLKEIAKAYSPFSIVIDDGSHVTNHQAVTARCLLPYVDAGGLYIIEDIHTGLKRPSEGRSVDFGEDIWPDFVRATFERLRQRPADDGTAGARLAAALAPRVDDLILSGQVLVLRKKDERPA